MRISTFSKLGNYFMHSDNAYVYVGAIASMCASVYVYAHAGLSNTRVMCAYPHKSTRKQAYMHETTQNQN